MDNSSAAMWLLIGLILGLGVGIPVGYMIAVSRNPPVKRNESVIISRNAQGQIDGIIEK